MKHRTDSLRADTDSQYDSKDEQSYRLAFPESTEAAIRKDSDLIMRCEGGPIRDKGA